jgi:hypothetical protein
LEYITKIIAFIFVLWFNLNDKFVLLNHSKLNFMNREKKLTEIQDLILETKQQGHCCFQDKTEIEMVNNCDLAIVAQRIALEKGILPQQAQREISGFYF